MITSHIGKENVGRIAERIVANELESHGFFVRDLNLEGLAANVDLLAVKDKRLWQIQVKGSSYATAYPDNGWWFQYGYCKDEHIQNPDARMFNKSVGSFTAEVVVLVCVRSPHEYQFIVLPTKIAEDAAQIVMNYDFRTKKADRSDHKPGPVWFDFFGRKARTPEKVAGIRQEQELVKPFLIDRSRSVAVDKRGQMEAHVSELFDRVFMGDEAAPLTDSLRG